MTLKAWREHVAKNCKDSYSLVVELAILILWESGADTEKKALKALEGLHLSGNQAEYAMQFSRKYKPSFKLDPIMSKVRKELK